MTNRLSARERKLAKLIVIVIVFAFLKCTPLGGGKTLPSAESMNECKVL
jgi:hypothetical protein